MDLKIGDDLEEIGKPASRTISFIEESLDGTKWYILDNGEIYSDVRLRFLFKKI